MRLAVVVILSRPMSLCRNCSSEMKILYRNAKNFKFNLCDEGQQLDKLDSSSEKRNHGTHPK